MRGLSVEFREPMTVVTGLNLKNPCAITVMPSQATTSVNVNLLAIILFAPVKINFIAMRGRTEKQRCSIHTHAAPYPVWWVTVLTRSTQLEQNMSPRTHKTHLLRIHEPHVGNWCKTCTKSPNPSEVPP